ncbi:MAG: hypothetical protein QM652_11795, partial [Legionella sp.]|uniref:hypothetical protein n=1 Tax=Legionella sp. TaxID=459 RepID=UPI0039E4042B
RAVERGSPVSSIKYLGSYQKAYILLDNYIITYTYNSLHTASINTINRMLIQNACPSELTYTHKHDDRDNYLFSPILEKYRKRANHLADFLVDSRCPKKIKINFLYNSGSELEFIFAKLASQKSRSSIHFQINSPLSEKEFDALISLLQSSNCPIDLRIDINVSIDISQYYKIFVVVMNNTTIQGLQLGFHLANNELASAILEYEEERILQNSRLNMYILSYANNLYPELIDRINRFQKKNECFRLLGSSSRSEE